MPHDQLFVYYKWCSRLNTNTVTPLISICLCTQNQLFREQVEQLKKEVLKGINDKTTSVFCIYFIADDASGAFLVIFIQERSRWEENANLRQKVIN